MSPSLWDDALASLPVEVQSILPKPVQGQKPAIDRALQQVTEAKVKCIKNRWKVKRQNGSVIVLRDVFEKIVTYIRRLKEIGDVIIQFDPVHAALPWAGVRLILELAASDFTHFEAVIEATETISRTVSRYALVEPMYLGHGYSSENEIRTSIVQLYGSILRLVAQAIKYLRANRVAQLIKGPAMGSFDSCTRQISAADAQVSSFLKVADATIQSESLAHLTLLSEKLKAWDEPINRIRMLDDSLTETVKREQFETISTWLSTVPYAHIHKSISDSLVGGTGQWLTDSEDFLEWWNGSTSSIFALSGPPGCGKTFLAAHVIEWASAAEDSTMAHFYCSKHPAAQNSSKTSVILQTMVKQLTCSSKDLKVHSCVRDRYTKISNDNALFGADVPPMDENGCISSILELLEHASTVLVVDAVDELTEPERHSLLAALFRLIDESNNVIKVLLTTRESIFFHANDARLIPFEVSSTSTSSDAVAFINAEVNRAITDKRLLHGLISDDDRHKLVQNIAQRADGIFMWAQLQIAEICRLETEDQVRSAVFALPKPVLSSMYARALDTCKKRGQSTHLVAFRVFAWIMCGKEELSTNAIVESLSDQVSKPTVATILNACSALVVCDKHLNRFRFAHTTVFEYLTLEFESHWHDLQADLARNCLHVCQRSEGLNYNTDDPMREIMQYSVLYWPIHAHSHQSLVAKRARSETAELQYVFDYCFADDTPSLAFLQWLEDACEAAGHLLLSHPMRKFVSIISVEDSSPIFMGCIYGLSSIVSRTLKSSPNQINSTNQYGQSPLYLASVFGHQDIVKICLDHGARHDIRGGNHQFALHAACFHGHSGIVCDLLAAGADYQQSNGVGSAFMIAVTTNHEDAALAFIPDYMKIHSQNIYETTLSEVAKTGMVRLIGKLENHFARFSSTSSQTKALLSACQQGQTQAVRRFLKSPDKPIKDLTTALAMVALEGHYDIAQLLIDAGASLSSETHLGSPLRNAALGGHLHILKMIVETATKFHAKLELSEAFNAAAINGHEPLLRFLAQMDLSDYPGKDIVFCALQNAAFHGQMAAFQYLLSVIPKMNDIMPLIEAATAGGQLSILQYLLENELEVHSVGYHTVQLTYSRVMCSASSPKRISLLRILERQNHYAVKKFIVEQERSWRLQELLSDKDLEILNQVFTNFDRDISRRNPLLIAVMKSDCRALALHLTKFTSQSGWYGKKPIRLIGEAIFAAVLKEDRVVLSVILEHWSLRREHVAESALLMAIANNNLPTFVLCWSYLNRRDSNFDCFSYTGWSELLPNCCSHASPIEVACQMDSVKIVDYLLSSTHVSDDLRRKTVSWVCKHDAVATMSHLVQRWPETWTAAKKNAWIIFSCENGSLRVLENLLESSPDLSPNMLSAWFWKACLRGHGNIASWIYKLLSDISGVDISSLKHAILLTSYICANLEMYWALLDQLLDLVQLQDDEFYTSILGNLGTMACAYNQDSSSHFDQCRNRIQDFLCELDQIYDIDANDRENISKKIEDLSNRCVPLTTKKLPQESSSFSTKVVTKLLDHGADIQAVGEHVLDAAVLRQDLDLMDLLLCRGVRSRSVWIKIALLPYGLKFLDMLLLHDQPSKEDQLQIFALFMNDLEESGADERENFPSEDMEHVIAEGPYTCLKRLLEHGFTFFPSQPYATLLLAFACTLGDSFIVSTLMRFGMDNFTGQIAERPSKSAASGKHVHIMELLLGNNRSITVGEFEDLISCQQPDTLCGFLKAGRCPKIDWKIMLKATREGNMAIFRMLYEAGGDACFKIKCSDHMTNYFEDPLVIFASQDMADGISFVLDIYKTHPSLAFNSSEALKAAMRRRCFKTVRMLLTLVKDVSELSNMLYEFIYSMSHDLKYKSSGYTVGRSILNALISSGARLNLLDLDHRKVLRGLYVCLRDKWLNYDFKASNNHDDSMNADALFTALKEVHSDTISTDSGTVGLCKLICLEAYCITWDQGNVLQCIEEGIPMSTEALECAASEDCTDLAKYLPDDEIFEDRAANIFAQVQAAGASCTVLRLVECCLMLDGPANRGSKKTSWLTHWRNHNWR
ncbi:hypothetical protein FH972_024880 [Carpinus fangiana]|uniref:AAA+ ATPase domain-containing protein n=1 Tax=Carpinus fangiana TaxID=176857 RepID=A0A5N6KZD9_9ROSI|nr:hypothetical protein FH972_024880 [Carpinus fangiana]